MILLNLNNLTCVQNMMVDLGYSGENFAGAVKKMLGCRVEVVKTFSWLESTSKQMTVLALLTLILRRF